MNKDLSKDFYRYVLPSMVSMLLSGFYSMVDGIFVGNAAGSQALAAINLVYPIQACMNATAFGLGVGGAVLMSKHMGSEEYEQADRAMGTTLPAHHRRFGTDGIFLADEGQHHPSAGRHR